MKTKLILALSLLILSSSVFANKGCFYGMSESEATSLKNAKADAYTLIYDTSLCSDKMLVTIKDELMKASEDKLSYLTARVEDSQNTLLGAFGSLGRHAEMKQKYELQLAKIQAALNLILLEMNKRGL